MDNLKDIKERGEQNEISKKCSTFNYDMEYISGG